MARFRIEFDVTTGLDDKEVEADSFEVKDGFLTFTKDSKCVAATRSASVVFVCVAG